MLFFFKGEKNNKQKEFYEMIDFELIKCIAIIELYIKEKWIEPMDKNTIPFSLLYHQTMSYLYSIGSCKPNELAKQILTLTPFKQIEADDYKKILRYLLKIGQLELDEDGNFLIGLNGEKIVNNFQFFSVFSTPIEYSVREASQEIGTVQISYQIGQQFSLAGFTWKVIDVNEEKRYIFVKKIGGTSKANWSDDGDFYISTKIMKKMQQILSDDEEYRYLDETSLTKLNEARALARNTNILKEKVVPCVEGLYYIFPWLGTKEITALKYSLEQQYNIDSQIKYNKGIPVLMHIKTDKSVYEINELLEKIRKDKIDKFKFNLPDTVEKSSKYNKFIPHELLKKQFIQDIINIEGMQENL